MRGRGKAAIRKNHERALGRPCIPLSKYRLTRQVQPPLRAASSAPPRPRPPRVCIAAPAGGAVMVPIKVGSGRELPNGAKNAYPPGLYDYMLQHLERPLLMAAAWRSTALLHFRKVGGSLPTCSDPSRPLIPADPHGLRETEASWASVLFTLTKGPP